MSLLTGLCLTALAAACAYYIPDPVRGVPASDPWFALPLRAFLSEGRAEPEALAICRPPECGPGMAVMVLRLTGPDAQDAWAVLTRPEGLAKALESAPRQPGRPATRASIARIQHEVAKGFAITLAPADNGKPPAYGIALGQREGEILRIVLAIGLEAAALEEAARRAATYHLGQ